MGTARPKRRRDATNYTVRIRGTAQEEAGGTLDGDFDRNREGSPADDFVWTFRFPIPNDDFANALTNNLDLRITAIVPPDATSGPITVVTPHGNVTSTANFQVLPPPLSIARQADGRVAVRWPASEFAAAPQIQDEAALRLLLELTGAGPEDTTLDVACGPGLVVCAFAERVRHATGMDLVPAMLEQARALQARKRLSNVSWLGGAVPPLPFADGTFTIVTARYAFHHLSDPGAVLAEMVRVCATGGRVLVCDVAASADPAKAEAFNRMERLRDPSHVRALPIEELQALFRQAGLGGPRAAYYRLEFELERLLQGSATERHAAGEVRGLAVQSLTHDTLGIGLRRDASGIHVAYPIVALCAVRP